MQEIAYKGTNKPERDNIQWFIQISAIRYNEDSGGLKEPPAGGARRRTLAGHMGQSLHSGYTKMCNKREQDFTATKSGGKPNMLRYCRGTTRALLRILAGSAVPCDTSIEKVDKHTQHTVSSYTAHMNR